MHLYAIADTNLAESSEFLSTYVNLKFISVSILVTVMIIPVYQLLRRVKSNVIGLLLALISLCSIIQASRLSLWNQCGIGRFVYLVEDVYSTASLALETTDIEYEISETSSLHPNIILIIGESFDKTHSNLYGYDKVTNPLLSKRHNDSTLMVFPSVCSPATMTHLSMRLMLTLADDCEDKGWIYKPMLVKTLSKCNYRSRWISNQYISPLFAQIRVISDACDSSTYLSEVDIENDNSNKVYDDVIFKPFEQYVRDIGCSNRNLCVLHIMGSHFRYDLRYPESYGKFKDVDYPALPVNQRKTIAQYDNSILFNDYVVDSLINAVDSIEAIVIYAPDHGEDLFYTGDIATHGNMSDPKSFALSTRIPFFIYFTKPFREKYPALIKTARESIEKDFDTRYLMNTIMDISGYDLSGYDVLKHSLFNGDFSRVSKDLVDNQQPQ